MPDPTALNATLVPVLEEHRFSLWKIRMKRYLWSLDKRMPECLTHGPFYPTKVSTGIPPVGHPDDAPYPPAGEIMIKPEAEWTEEDKVLDSLDRRVAHFLTVAVQNSSFEQIVMCETAKEIWDELCEYFDGDEACKSNKLYNCILAFDTFKKDPKESLRDCQNRFTKVLNDCRALGKIYTVKEVNMRFLSCLGAAWHIKITSLKDSKDLNVMSLKNLVSNLTTYESELKQLLEPEKYMKTLSLKAQSESSVRITSLSDDSESEEDENAFMARKFPKYRKFYKSFKSKQNQQSSSFQRTPKRPLLKASSSSSSKTPSDDLLCFNCRKPGHFSSKCPMPKFEYFKRKSPKQKQKGMVANEEPKEMPVWCETDSEEEAEDTTEGTESALVVVSEADLNPSLYFKKEPTFLDPATKILDKTIKVPNCGEFICYKSGESSYTHLPPENPFSKPKLRVDPNEGKSKVSKKKKTSESTVAEYVPIEVLEEMNEMCKEYEKLQVLNKKILNDLHVSQTANSALTSEVATLKKDLEELNLLRDEKIAFEILCGKLNAQLESKQKTIEEMSNTLRSLNSSKAAVDTILQSQKSHTDLSGLGYNTSSVQTASTADTNQSSGCDLDILKDLLPVVTHDPTGKDYSKVQHEYPKRTGKKKGKTQTKLGSSDDKASDDRPPASKASVGTLASAKVSDKAKPKGESHIKGSSVSKMTPVKFVPARDPAKGKGPLVDNEEHLVEVQVTQHSTFLHCFLCNGDGHQAMDCLERLNPGPPMKDIPKGRQVWSPKGN